jgi:hypothetical protein
MATHSCILDRYCMLSTTTWVRTVGSTLRQTHHFYRSCRPLLARAPAIAPSRIAGRLDTGYCVLQSRVRHIGLRTLAKSAGCSRDDDVLRVVSAVPHMYVFSRTIVAVVHCHHTLSCNTLCPRLPELIGHNHYVSWLLCIATTL